MAMISQFLGFMLDAYDMALVLIMAPILVKFSFTQRQRRLAIHRDRVYVLHHHGGPAIGSAIFGRYADKIGRRFLLVFTIGGVA